MPTPFTGVNLTNWYNNVGYVPGAGPFYWADKYYQGDFKNAEAGGGLGQLTAAGQADPSAANYRQTGFAPAGAGQNAALGAYSGLINAQRAAQSAGRQVSGRQAAGDLSGALDTSSAEANSIENQLSAQIALRNAQAAQGSSVMGDITGGVDLAAGIGSEIIAPGNPIGINMALGGAGTIAGSNMGGGNGGGSFMGAGGSGGLGGIFSQFYNKYGPHSSLPNQFDPSFGTNIDPSEFSLLAGAGAP